MAIVYLDVDDEITSAAARMRDAKERRIAFVLPGGSRLGTSRINFRLLAREAQLRGRTIAIVAPDAPTRSLAASAGLPTFATVFEYEESLAPSAQGGPGAVGRDGRGGGDSRGGAPAGAASASAATGAGAATGGSGAAAVADARSGARTGGASRSGQSAVGPDAAREDRRGADDDTAEVDGRRDRPGPRSAAAAVAVGAQRRQGPRMAVVVLGIVVALLLAAGGVAAWLILPSATVNVVARAEAIQLDLSIRADPAVTTADPTNLVVPAQRATFQLSVTDTFPATGTKVDETPAKGSVRWTNCDPTRSYQIAAGTPVRTRDGVAFTTDEAVFVAVATLTGNPPQITCQSRDVSVTAVTPGTAGNVGAGEITVVPGSYNSVVVRVTNPAATSGGTHTETTVVAQKDVAAATKQLQGELATKLKAEAGAPGNTPPGTTAFPATATMSGAAPTTDPTTLVDQAMDSFTLGMAATGSVTVVDSSAVSDLAAQRIQANLAAGHDLVSGSEDVKIGSGSVDGQAVTFPVTASARQIRRLDADQLRAAIKGRSVDDARRILAPYGEVTIDTWPGWVSAIPTLDFRLDLRVSASPSGTAVPSTTASPGASSGAGSASPASPSGTSPTPAPSPSAGASASGTP